ncbi:electron transfer flavoprotein subunit beta, partial [Hortaea werneckii]
MSGLRILVPVKRVIDYAVKPRVNKAQTAVETNGVKHSMNPFDELSIEEAVRLRERQKPVEDILAFSAGPAKSQDILRTAMAMGADRGLHVVEEKTELEPLGVAKMLKKVVEDEKRNLVILGKQSIDDDANQTGQMLAGLLGWSQATQASKVELDGETVTVTKEVDGGVETVRAKLPMVITTDLRLNEPRYASLPNIMKAKKKPLEKKSLADYGIDMSKRLQTVKVAEPPARQGGGKVENVDGLIGKLKELGAMAAEMASAIVAMQVDIEGLSAQNKHSLVDVEPGDLITFTKLLPDPETESTSESERYSESEYEESGDEGNNPFESADEDGNEGLNESDQQSAVEGVGSNDSASNVTSEQE